MQGIKIIIWFFEGKLSVHHIAMEDKESLLNLVFLNLFIVSHGTYRKVNKTKMYHSVIFCGANICVTLLKSRTRTLWHYVLHFLSTFTIYMFIPHHYTLAFFAWIFLNFVNGIIQCLFFCVWLLLLNIIFAKYAQIVCKLISLYFHCYLVFSIWFYVVYPFIHFVHVHLSYFQMYILGHYE